MQAEPVKQHMTNPNATMGRGAASPGAIHEKKGILRKPNADFLLQKIEKIEKKRDNVLGTPTSRAPTLDASQVGLQVHRVRSPIETPMGHQVSQLSPLRFSDGDGCSAPLPARPVSGKQRERAPCRGAGCAPCPAISEDSRACFSKWWVEDERKSWPRREADTFQRLLQCTHGTTSATSATSVGRLDE